jgi:hypothetical protein
MNRPSSRAVRNVRVGSKLDSQACKKVLLAQSGETQSTAAHVANDPLLCHSVLQERGSEGAGDVWPTLAPVETGVCEPAPESAYFGDVDS